MRTKRGPDLARAKQKMRVLHVRPVRRPVENGRAARHRSIVLTGANLCLQATVGRSGVGVLKREGDGKTPSGRYRILGGYYRPDRTGRRGAHLGLRPLRKSDGWCDDPAKPAYNRPVHLPTRGSAENMWRDDQAYDAILILDYNFFPRARGRGSAIFFHIWRSPGHPTEGCVAISPVAMRRLLPRLSGKVILDIHL